MLKTPLKTCRGDVCHTKMRDWLSRRQVQADGEFTDQGAEDVREVTLATTATRMVTSPGTVRAHPDEEIPEESHDVLSVINRAIRKLTVLRKEEYARKRDEKAIPEVLAEDPDLHVQSPKSHDQEVPRKTGQPVQEVALIVAKGPAVRDVREACRNHLVGPDPTLKQPKKNSTPSPPAEVASQGLHGQNTTNILKTTKVQRTKRPRRAPSTIKIPLKIQKQY
jgi:hypothetical protein